MLRAYVDARVEAAHDLVDTCAQELRCLHLIRVSSGSARLAHNVEHALCAGTAAGVLHLRREELPEDGVSFPFESEARSDVNAPTGLTFDWITADLEWAVVVNSNVGDSIDRSRLQHSDSNGALNCCASALERPGDETRNLHGNLHACPARR